MHRAALILGLALLPAPLLAQEAGVTLDADLVPSCLAAQSGEGGDPESCIGIAAAACMDQPGGYSTVGMSSCLGLEHEIWDALLNDTYEQVMTGAEAMDADAADLSPSTPKQVPALREMQRSWIAFRDAACAFEYSRWGGGTGGGPAGVQCALTLTARQALWLTQYQARP